MDYPDFQTTYVYTKLPSPSHIRLLHILNKKIEDPAFETISYTWGHPKRVSSLPLHNNPGFIGLTQSLTHALPHLVRESTTDYLWIDQLCINQTDGEEKAIQVGMMDKIYKAAERVIVWLGPGDEHSVIVGQWLHFIASFLESRDDAERTVLGADAFNASHRMLVVRSTWVSPTADASFALAARRFWGRRWFRRSWIVQELLLSREAVFLAGAQQFSLQDLADLQTLPPDMAFDDADLEHSQAYNTLLLLKRFPLREPQPLAFLVFMAQVASTFETTELADRLYAFLGMLPGSSFTPDYNMSIRWNYTAFAVSFAKTYGSIDFLSLWAAIIDAQIPNVTPKEVLGFASWVPSWTWLPLQAPHRLAGGATRALFDPVAWNACRSRKHMHTQDEDAVQTERLHVKGKVIDCVSRLSAARIDSFAEPTDAYLDSIVAQIKADLPFSGYAAWDRLDLVSFLNTIAANGNAPKTTAESVLGLAPTSELVNNLGYNDALSAVMAIGPGRRFVVTEEGRMGLVPFVGSKGGSGEESGSVIAVLHGCIVPIVLESVGEGEGGSKWRVVGDCYVEGVMHGEGVEWGVEEGDVFVLV